MLPLTRLALDNSRVVILLTVLLIIAGPLSFVTHPSREDPKITIRTALVSVNFPGMSPERVENLITRKIEEKIRQIPEIEHILSTTRTGQSLVRALIYERYFDVDSIWIDLRNKMEDVKSELPEGSIGPLVNDDYGDVAMATIAITAEGFSMAEMRKTARNMRDKLYGISGVRKISFSGIEDERIFIEIDNSRLIQLGISQNDIINTLKTQNVILPGGEIEAGALNFVIEPSGNFESVDDIASLTLEIPNEPGQVAYLRDIAKVTRGYVDPPESPAFFNGKPAIVVSVSMIDNFDAFKFGQDLKDKVIELEGKLPIGYQLTFMTFQPEDIANAVYGVVNNLLQTVLIVLVIVMLFLGWRTGLIVGGLMVPMTMLLTLLVMRQAGIELERMSLATLIISLGLLVDNGIVIAEEISRRLALGEDRRSAAIETGQGMAVPLLTSSLTTIFAFMPLMLADSTAGEYTRSISQVIAITLLGSWLISLTVTPLACYWFMARPRNSTDEETEKSLLKDIYRRGLNLVLDNRLIFLAAIGGLFALAMVAFSHVPKIFFPNSERTEIQIIVEHQVGGNSPATLKTVEKLTRWLTDKKINPEIQNTVAYVAGGGPRFYLSLDPPDSDPNRAFVLIKVARPDQIVPMIARLTQHTNDHYPAARIQVKPMSLGPAEAGLVEYRISGPSSDRLKAASEKLQTAIRAVPGNRNAKDDWENRWVKVIVKVDQARARRLGVTSEDIARELRNILTGNEATSFREDDLAIPVVLRAQRRQRTNLDRLRTLLIPTRNGGNVPLIQIATLDAEPQFSLIQRRDLERTITVTASNSDMTAAEFDARLQGALGELDLPQDYRIEVGGELESSSKAQGSLFANMPLAFGLMVLVLVIQFSSFRRTLIILATIPLTIMGIAFALFLAPGANFGFMAILGILALAGIIINNGIVLIDRIDIERGNGLALREAVVSASLKRLRPILMATTTTVFGLTPIILSKDVLFYDLAIVISGGLLLGTILTLGFVPMVYLTVMSWNSGETNAADAASQETESLVSPSP